jgi:putrescine transport system permease protein
MITRAEVPHPQRRSVGAHLLLRFLETLPPYRWTRSRLVQWGVTGRTAVIAVPYLWLLLFFLIPFVIVLKIGFSETQIALPPYQPLFAWTQERILEIKLNVGNFLYLVETACTGRVSELAEDRRRLDDPVPAGRLPDRLSHRRASGTSAQHPADDGDPAVLDVVPAARVRVDRHPQEQRAHQQLSDVARRDRQPLVMLQTDFAIYVGIVYSYLPFMILPLYTSLEKMDLTLLEAAADLGSRPWKAFMQITLPLSIQGIVAGSLLVFIPRWVSS